MRKKEESTVVATPKALTVTTGAAFASKAVVIATAVTLEETALL